jgi:glycosyltransferase involved in cell wall biosynthesis
MKIAILHYSVAPVVGGVESVIQEHAKLLLAAGYKVKLVAGAGEQSSLPDGVEFACISEMDSRHPGLVNINQQLDAGQVPADFERFTAGLEMSMDFNLADVDIVVIHNIFTKHFNLPLSVALLRLIEKQKFKRCIAWCHDISWTSSHSLADVHPGYPWDVLRKFHEDVTYVAVSEQRQVELSGLFQCPKERIRVIYNGVDPADIYGLSAESRQLVSRLRIEDSDLIMLMPVRITQAKNIELAMRVVSVLKKNGIKPKLIVTGPPDPHDPADMQYYQALLDLRHSLQVEQEARFVYESGPIADEGYIIETQVVMELYRLCDLLFIPSHREGFGMPILEAGLIGKPIFTTPIPAAEEIGNTGVTRFFPEDPPEKVAELLMNWATTSQSYALMKLVRLNYTWQAIFRRSILPLIQSKEVK